MRQNFFRKRRDELEKTQRELSIELDVTVQTIGEWERDDHPPRLALVPKLAKAYQVNESVVEDAIVQMTRRLTATAKSA